LRPPIFPYTTLFRSAITVGESKTADTRGTWSSPRPPGWLGPTAGGAAGGADRGGGRGRVPPVWLDRGRHRGRPCQRPVYLVRTLDRKSTRLNSSHSQ